MQTKKKPEKNERQWAVVRASHGVQDEKGVSKLVARLY